MNGAPPNFSNVHPKIDLQRSGRVTRAESPRRVPALPAPNHPEAEQALIGCVLWEPGLMAGPLGRVSPEVFHDLRHATIWAALRAMHAGRELIDLVTLQARLGKEKRIREVGGVAYLSDLMDKVPSSANWSYYLELVREPFAKRKLAGILHSRLSELNDSATAPRDFVLGLQSELETAAKLGGTNGDKPALTMWQPTKLAALVVPDHLRLVGDNEIVKGYEGLALIGGPGSSGKSLVAMTLAIAGCPRVGEERPAFTHWQGRAVHRTFKTMFLQAENGAVRLKEEFEAIVRNHPELALDEHILISAPPEGGLPFHKPQFRAAVREEAAKFKPDLVVIDTWAQVAADDAAKDIIEKIGEIRSCFPGGDDFPSILILAHTSKPRADVVRKGRGLINAISGSIALANTSRCVYILLPWSDETEDQRIYWSCVKLNNGKMYPPTVWQRRFGTMFEHDAKTDPRDFGKTDDEDRHKLNEDHVRAAFDKVTELRSGDLVKKLCKATGCGEATAWRAIGEDGHLRGLLMRAGTGKLKLKEVTA